MSWEVYAIRYADDPGRTSARCFLDAFGGDAPMPTAYHAFLLRGPAGVVMVDTGADAAVLQRLNKPVRGSIPTALAALGVAPEEVTEVVQTHLHWDHAGGTALFPRARFHLQAREMAYVTGPAMRHAVLRAGYETTEIAAMLPLLHDGRLVLHDGDWTGPGGLSAFHLGGHTDGLQALALPTRRGRLCLAGDAVALHANLRRRVPFPALFHVGDALDAFDRVLAEAGGPEAVIPGHDVAVVDAHPPARHGTEGWIARLD
ncbi:N-acyl homoserine lactonase family protein [Roseomonas sp. BN140053]|uniref:N-acyl homoserine lactonase family protein n=1 Tax=Roseomonas sp. BN140053 TaxID=3391898 RepID=UPI0039EA74B5